MELMHPLNGKKQMKKNGLDVYKNLDNIEKYRKKKI